MLTWDFRFINTANGEILFFTCPCCGFSKQPIELITEFGAYNNILCPDCDQRLFYNTQQMEDNFKNAAINYIRDSGFSLKNNFDMLPKEKKKELLEKDCMKIKYCMDPSEEEQLLAVRKNYKSIQYIYNPSEKVQLEAFKLSKNDIDIWELIENPCEKINLIIIKSWAGYIEFVKSPSEEVQLIAVSKCGNTIRYIKNPSEAVQLAAVKKSGSSINYIKNPSEKVKIEAIKKSPGIIARLKNPSEECIRIAIEKYGKKTTKNNFPKLNLDEEHFDKLPDDLKLLILIKKEF